VRQYDRLPCWLNTEIRSRGTVTNLEFARLGEIDGRDCTETRFGSPQERMTEMRASAKEVLVSIFTGTLPVVSAMTQSFSGCGVRVAQEFPALNAASTLI
jgi:hypothetical protein